MGKYDKPHIQQAITQSGCRHIKFYDGSLSPSNNMSWWTTLFCILITALYFIDHKTPSTHCHHWKWCWLSSHELAIFISDMAFNIAINFWWILLIFFLSIVKKNSNVGSKKNKLTDIHSKDSVKCPSSDQTQLDLNLLLMRRKIAVVFMID